MISHVNNAVRASLNHRSRRRRPVSKRRPRSATSVAALGYLAQGPIERGLVPIEELTCVVLYGDAAHSGRWLAGYSAQRVPWGVAWGGVERNEFLKDLCLPPRIGGRAAQLDLQQAALVELAFQLNQCLEQQQRSGCRRFRNAWSCPGSGPVLSRQPPIASRPAALN